jgi:hypothetical protein
MTSETLSSGEVKKRTIIGFGETVQGYDVPVLNEREIRAAAGIMFLAMLLSFMLIIFRENFLPIKYVIILFLIDFTIRIFVNPQYSPMLIVGRFIVGGQTPEYVGAAQKRFAWIIGLSLASIMFVLMVVVNSYSPITGISCLLCLVFMFFESSFGICLGCLVYNRIHKNKAGYCPGDICETKTKHDIQRLSFSHVSIVIGYIVLVLCTAHFFNESLSKKPMDLMNIAEGKQGLAGQGTAK